MSVPFKKTSLKARERKKKLKRTGKSLLFFGKTLAVITVGALLALPKLLARRRSHERQKSRLPRIILSSVFVIGAFLTAFAWSDIGQRAGKAFVKETVFSLGTDLPKDEHGFTNILITGVGGGETHAAKGAKLTDSMIVASIDATGRSVVLLSIPRDFYVENALRHGRINETVRDESAIFLRELRNQPEHAAALKTLKGEERQKYMWQLDAQADRRAEMDLIAKIEEILDIDIHRIARIDFTGFEKAIDAIGGIDVIVDKAISDDSYPDAEWGYDPFYLAAGPQHLDGKTALKFARSRHDSSDFARAARQQKVISAIKEKLASLDVLASPTKLKQLFGVFQDNFHSDLTWEEIISLAEIGSKMPRDHIFTYVLNNNPLTKGGFLVTPDRSLYGGAFVLVPFLNTQADKYAQIRAFAEMIFTHRAITGTDPFPITILNGTKREGIGNIVKSNLERYGWNIADVDNASQIAEKTVVRFTDTPRNNAAALLLQKFMDIALEPIPKVVSITPGAKSKDATPTPLPVEVFEITIGNDFKNVYRSPLFPPHNG